jgi:hypothetical protein
MANCKVSKVTFLKRFEKMQNDLDQLDVNYLVGKVNERGYKGRRNILKRRFVVLKKRLNKC